jgi:hypothetical protein
MILSLIQSVNQMVSGSNPAGGAKKSITYKVADGDFVSYCQ